MKQKSYNHGSSNAETQRQEDAEANLFAMELLMPEEFVRKAVRDMGGIDLANAKALKKLADKFKVDPGIMAISLGQLSK